MDDGTAIILGAGASFDCVGDGVRCIPLTRDLVRFDPNSELAQLAEELSGHLNPQTDDFRDFFGAKLESAISWAQCAASSNEEETAILGLKTYRLIVKEVIAAIQESQVRAIGHDEESGYYFSAMNYLFFANVARLDDSVSLITLNYDCLLDLAFGQLPTGGEVSQFASWKHLLSDSSSWETAREQLSGYYLKLHGSLDLHLCLNEQCKLFATVFRSGFVDMKVMKTGLLRCPACQAFDTIPALVPPSSQKMTGLDELSSNLMGLAGRILQRSSRWIVVGYSFPDYDADMHGLLANALAFRQDKELNTHIVVISPDAPIVAQRLANIHRVDVDGMQLSVSAYVEMKHKDWAKSL